MQNPESRINLSHPALESIGRLQALWYHELEGAKHSKLRDSKIKSGIKDEHGHLEGI